LLYEYVLARRVRTDQPRVEGVGASGERPKWSAREARSLHVDQHVDGELT
jgi:hypothetical protein